MDIITLDLDFQNLPQIIASYLIVGPAGPVLVESGPASTYMNLRAGLSQHGFKITDVKHVLVTHIHLDHAGAAGRLAQEGAQIYVHKVGAPHLIDPSRLLTSAGRIYGDKMDILWGETVPAPADRVKAVADGDVLNVAGLQFTALNTPGHAWHHHTYRLGNVAFTGDAAGIQIPETDLVELPAPPPEFKLEVWEQSIDRLLAENFEAIYPTHFGRLNNPVGQLEGLQTILRQAAEFVRVRMESGQDRETIVEAYVAWIQSKARAAGLSEYTIKQLNTVNPLYMSADGIMHFWRRVAAKQK
ncbi:MAG: MBL fold metallo-hydrolase [Chloroflexi bacterium]|jgi:glyoxylase-like metal-dependent hydrolase (beta-lactamase superfamily II)|nr:MBL fold metallo-hydrolase [Chloroflexota bacterium]